MLRRNRNLALVVFARFISRFGGAAVWFIGVWGTAAYVFEATPGHLAGMSFVNGMAAIVGSLTAGVLIDRFGPRRVMVWAEVFSIPPLIAMLFVDSFMPFVACSAVYALFGVPTWTAGASFAPYIVEGAKPLERANAFIEGGAALGFVLGPAVAAVLSQNVGIAAVFVMTALACAAAGVAAWFTRIDETPRAHVSGNAWTEFTSGLRLAYTSRSLRFYIFMGTAVWFGFGAFSALEPLFYRDVVGVDVAWIGWMNTAYGIGLISGAALLPRLPQKIISARGLASLVVLCGLGTVLYVGSTDLRLIAVGALAWGSFLGATEPLLRTLLHLDSPHEYVGRIVGTTQWHRSAGELVPLAFVPVLAASIGIQETLIGGGLIVAVIALVGVGFSGRIDRHRAAAIVLPPDVAREVA
ncbi:MAG: MFS transporter [Aeromicrobium sp.]|nr:MFS transporter [Aeromicrobium sp.]